MSRSPARYLLYSHDTYGLGHFRRAALLAAGIVSKSPDAHVLIATGSPQAQAFVLPDRVDTLKLPCATKGADGRYRPRRITNDIDDLVELRAGLLLAAGVHFRPDVVLVDQAPIGMAGELVPLLQALHAHGERPRLVLGLRDIVDDALDTERQWRSSGAWDWLERYDDLLVYGDESILTTARELELDRRLVTQVTHVGYVAPAMPEPFGAEPFVLVTPGGGGDGQRLLRGVLDAVERGALGGLQALVVTGPLLSASRRAELVVRAGRRGDVRMIEFSDNMRQLISSASGVISMAGYNTVVEELAAGTPAMLVPRTVPRLEQDIRARRLGPRTNLERCPVEHLTPRRVAAFVERVADGGHCNGHDLRLDGVDRVAAVLTGSEPAAASGVQVRGVAHV